MRKNNIKIKWKKNNAIINGWLAIPNSFSAEIMANEDWDSITIDLQHGLIDYSNTISMLQAISSTNSVPLVRVPWNEPGIIMKMLDAGAYGIICPMINTKIDCERFVQASRYPPLGYRSFGPLRANIYSGNDYFTYANEEILTMAMIETKEAVNNLDDILSVEGLDAIYIGPSDLSISYTNKHDFDIENSLVYDVINQILEKTKKHNIQAGIHVGSTSYAHKMLALGFNFVTILSEAKIMTDAIQKILKEMRINNKEKKKSLY